MVVPIGILPFRQRVVVSSKVSLGFPELSRPRRDKAEKESETSSQFVERQSSANPSKMSFAMRHGNRNDSWHSASDSIQSEAQLRFASPQQFTLDAVCFAIEVFHPQPCYCLRENKTPRFMHRFSPSLLHITQPVLRLREAYERRFSLTLRPM